MEQGFYMYYTILWKAVLANSLCSCIILSIMAKDIHPKYYDKAKVTCACGNSFTVGSTQPELHVEVCGKCHPFYTGEEKMLDVAGRVEKFKARRTKAVTVPKAKKVRTKKAKK